MSKKTRPTMMKRFFRLLLATLAGMTSAYTAVAQVTERERPAEWNSLVDGGRFLDRFLPMRGNRLSSECWGVDGVKPRLTDNGIEDMTWSYWGGNIIRGAEDGKYHLFVCGWLESSPKGHSTWPSSQVFNAESDNPWGPFVIKDIIGGGHNPEVYRAKGGKYVLYTIHRRYVAQSINGPWEKQGLSEDGMGWGVKLDQSNETFAVREDSSVLMVSRNGQVFISQTGLTPFKCVATTSVYPKFKGDYEDPIVWRDNVQYNLIVNDWRGRIAYYMRSKDGINWVCDPGEAYTPGISMHDDGKQEQWFKYERMKVLQDEHGRAVQANFAVIDTLKPLDKGRDNHSSKNICIPLNPGLLLEIVGNKAITPKTKQIRVRVKAEDGFNPQTDIDLRSLRFGASTEVNYGRGCRVLSYEADGNDIIVTFDGRGNGIKKDEFAPKLIGRYSNGKMLYGYARLPYVRYVEPILTAYAPKFEDGKCIVTVCNMGQVASRKATVRVESKKEGHAAVVAKGEIGPLSPYAETTVSLPSAMALDNGEKVTVSIVEK